MAHNKLTLHAGAACWRYAVLRDLGACMQSAHSNPSVKAIVITGAGDSFCAGFDINQFVSGDGLDGDANEMFCQGVEAGPKPTVAAIKGVALGGGLEVCLFNTLVPSLISSA